MATEHVVQAQLRRDQAQLRRSRSEVPFDYLFGELPSVRRPVREHRHRRPAREVELEFELDLDDLLASQSRQAPVTREPQQAQTPPRTLPREREQLSVRGSQRQDREGEQFDELLSRLLGFPVSLASVSQPQGQAQSAPAASTSVRVSTLSLLDDADFDSDSNRDRQLAFGRAQEDGQGQAAR